MGCGLLFRPGLDRLELQVRQAIPESLEGLEQVATSFVQFNKKKRTAWQVLTIRGEYPKEAGEPSGDVEARRMSRYSRASPFNLVIKLPASVSPTLFQIAILLGQIPSPKNLSHIGMRSCFSSSAM